MNFECGGQLTEQEHTAAQWLHIKPRILFALLASLLVALICCVLCMLLLGGFDDGIAIIGGVLLASAVYIAFLYLFWMPRRWRRIYRQHKALQRPQTFQITEDALKVTSESGNGSVRWDEFLKWKEGNGMFLLYPNEILFFVLTPRFFASPEQVNDFRAFLASKIQA